MTRSWRGGAEGRNGSLLALGLFCLVSFLYFGVRLLLDPGGQYIGPFDDPQIEIWAFAWYPHAILHGENPLVTHAIWAPVGVNLTWTTTAPGLCVLFAPVTWLAGPVTSYNIASLLLPAVSAWTAFLLCRRLTRSFWASLVGGYLFGFSSYMLGHEEGHFHMQSIFLIPLIALVAWRYLEGELDGRGLIARLAPLLIVQLLFSTEMVFTVTLAFAGSLILAYAVVPARRLRLRSLAGAATLAYLAAGVVTAPFLYYLVRGLHTHAYVPPQAYNADLLNFVVPTDLDLAGHGWSKGIASHFPGNYSENGAFLGPAILIVALFAWRSWRTPGGRFLLAALGIAGLAALGPQLTVYGHHLLWLPWSLVINLPLWDNVLPVRLALYVWLVVAVVAALWIASRRHWALRLLLPALAVLALLPDFSAHVWASTYAVPPFFTDSAYRSCLSPGATILPEPIGPGGAAMLWQTADDFRFRMAGGRVQQMPPSPFMHPATREQVSGGNPVPASQAGVFRAFIRDWDISDVVVDPRRGRAWIPALDRVVKPQNVGGVLLYRVSGDAPPCNPSA